MADVAGTLLKEAPGKLISVHAEMIGKIRLDQLNKVEAMIKRQVLAGRIAINGHHIAYHPPSVMLPALGYAAAGRAAAGCREVRCCC